MDYESCFKSVITSWIPRDPRLIMVSATVCLLTDPSFRIFQRVGRAAYAIAGPIALIAIQAVVQTFQYWLVNSLINIFFDFIRPSGPSQPIAQRANDLTFASSSLLLHNETSSSRADIASGSPIRPSIPVAVSLTPPHESFKAQTKALIMCS